MVENGPSDFFGLLRKQAALQDALLNRAVDVAETHRVAEFDLGIEVFENALSLFAGFRRPFERHVIAVGMRRNSEPALYLGDILVVLAEQQRSEAIVVEGQSELGIPPVGRSRGFGFMARGGSRIGLADGFDAWRRCTAIGG